MEAILFEGLSSTVIAFCSVCVLVSLISYLVYKFSIKEKSFEEVLEEQKRHQLEEEAKQKLEKSKKKEKFKRNWSKKKEKADTEPAVAEIIAPTEEKDIPLIVEPKETKNGKQKNKKQSPVSSNPPTDVQNGIEKPVKVVSSENTTAETKKSPQMKQDGKKESAAQIKKENVSKSKKELPQATKESENKVSPKQVVVEPKKKNQEIVEKVVAPAVNQAASSNNLPAKKKKKEIVEADLSQLSANKLFSLIKDAALDDNEIQHTIDILLNKQKDSAGWTKPNDPLANAKRTLQEKEQRLELEMQQNKNIVLKMKEVRDENTQLKEKYSALEKSSQDKIGKMQHEIQVFQNRLKQSQDTQVKDKEPAKVEKQSADKKKPGDDANKPKATKVEVEPKNTVNKPDQDSAKLLQLQKAHNLLIEQHTQFVSTHNRETKQRNAQIADLEKIMKEFKAKNASLSKDVQAAKDAKAALEKAKITAEEKLKNELKLTAELDLKMKTLNSSSSNVTDLQTQIKNLQLENERLTEQLVSTKERVAGDGQEIIHQNGEVNGNIPDEATLKSLEEKSQLLKEKESDLSRVNEELNQLKAKLGLIENEGEEQKKKNNDLREKNWKAMEVLKQSEELAESRLKELEASKNKFNETTKAYEAKLNAQDSSKTLADAVAKVESEAAKKLNVEVEKNKQLALEVERLNAQNSSLPAMKKTVEELSSQIKDGQCRTRECMQRIHPEVSVDSTLSHDAWVEEFEKLVLLSAKVTTPSNEEEVKLLKSRLEEKDAELSMKEQHYKTMLSETESVLTKLERSAQSNENTYQERLKVKENELQNLLSEKEKLKKENEAAQATFQQLGQLEELQGQLKELKSTVEAGENERSQLEQKYDEVNKNCINLRDQLANKETQIAELQKEITNVESLRKLTEDFKEKLEKEKKISKDFSSQMVKLHSLVKIGQDSLAAEQELVRKLKSELEAAKVSTTNGGATITNTVTQSESRIRTKSTDKSKKKSDASVKK